jgi:ABC-type glycerol-3-phosphate transport system substrate-binding protein
MSWVTLELGAVATTTAALNSPEAANKENLALYKHALRTARPWPSHPGIIPIANNVFAPWFQKAVVGQLTPEEAMSGAAREAQEILDGNQ